MLKDSCGQNVGIGRNRVRGRVSLSALCILDWANIGLGEHRHAPCIRETALTTEVLGYFMISGNYKIHRYAYNPMCVEKPVKLKGHTYFIKNKNKNALLCKVTL